MQLRRGEAVEGGPVSDTGGSHPGAQKGVRGHTPSTLPSLSDSMSLLQGVLFFWPLGHLDQHSYRMEVRFLRCRQNRDVGLLSVA